MQSKGEFIMSILKFVNKTPKPIHEMYSYLTDPQKTTQNMIFGINVNPYNAGVEMEFTQEIFHVHEIRNPYVQVIFAFDQGLNISPLLALNICKRIGYSFAYDNRQIFGAMHYNKPHQIHCHYMINYVSIDGSLWRQGKSVVSYKSEINEILRRYHLNPIYYYGQ